MTTEGTLPRVDSAVQSKRDSSSLDQSWTRKAGPVRSLAAADDSLYPSPPMSTSQSPPQTSSDPAHNTAASTASLGPSTTASVSSASSALPGPPPAFAVNGTGVSSHDGPAPPVQMTVPHGNHSHVHPASYDFNFKVLPPFASQPTLATVPSTRTGRKSKAHVASACINCKRAHLSCDVQRPCNRCVTSGKQDSCHNVPHKKRGRPRLRDENGVKTGQTAAERAAQTAAPAVQAPASARPIATPRHRRTDSSRSHSSFAVDALPHAYPGYFPPSDLRTSQSYHQPMPGNLPPADIPTAFLDLDLMVLRANRPFKQIMSNGAEIIGRHISELAISLDNHRFGSIHAGLLAERDGREPSHLPPILPLGHDQLQGVSEMDADRLTYGFEDRAYTWARNAPGPIMESFPARVRLGKASSYFVVLTLPSFRPYLPASTPMPPSQAFAVAPPPPPPASLMASRLTPPYHTHGSQSMPAHQYHPRHSASYPPQSGWSPPNQHGMPPAAPRLPPPPEPPMHTMDKTSYYRKPSFGDIGSPVGLGVQLPPIGKDPYTRLGPFSRCVEPSYHTSSSSEEDGNESFPNKRRRVGMGIDEVLQP